jgi:hypothetical protein
MKHWRTQKLNPWLLPLLLLPVLLPAPRRRSPTPPDVRRKREQEREFAELERATRTVFAFNINIKADERDIFTFFSPAGQVGLEVLGF